MARGYGASAIAALESGDEESAMLYLTAFCEAHTDTRTPMVVDAVMLGDYKTAAGLMRLQLAFT